MSNHFSRALFLLPLAACTEAPSADDGFFRPAETVSDVAPERAPLAAPRLSDLVSSLTAPVQAPIGSTLAIVVRIQNMNGVGQEAAANAAATVTLPAGVTAGSLPSGCTSTSPTTVRCTYGTLAGGYAAYKTINVVLPSVGGAVTFTATASTTSTEATTSNNGSSRTVTVAVPPQAVAIAPPQAIEISDCFGVTSYAQCNPQAIMAATMILNANGTVDTGTPDVTGVWVRPAGPTTIKMTFTDVGSGQVLSIFGGFGVSATCFEGIVSTPAPNIPDGAFRACI